MIPLSIHLAIFPRPLPKRCVLPHSSATRPHTSDILSFLTTNLANRSVTKDQPQDPPADPIDQQDDNDNDAG